MRAGKTFYGLALAAVAAVAGCADGARAPTEATPATSRIAAHRGAFGSQVTTVSGDTVTDVITLRADRGGDFRLGGQHWIHFPESAVCDPATSSYGPGEWDAPCRPVKGQVRITAVSYRDASGHPRVDFSPELRFVSGRKSNDWVYLALADSTAAAWAQPVINYCGPDGGCVDESVSDASLVTHKSLKHGLVFRRIKHFSGYMISAGRTELDAL